MNSCETWLRLGSLHKLSAPVEHYPDDLEFFTNQLVESLTPEIDQVIASLRNLKLPLDGISMLGEEEEEEVEEDDEEEEMNKGKLGGRHLTKALIQLCRTEVENSTTEEDEEEANLHVAIIQVLRELEMNTAADCLGRMAQIWNKQEVRIDEGACCENQRQTKMSLKRSGFVAEGACLKRSKDQVSLAHEGSQIASLHPDMSFNMSTKIPSQLDRVATSGIHYNSDIGGTQVTLRQSHPGEDNVLNNPYNLSLPDNGSFIEANLANVNESQQQGQGLSDRLFVCANDYEGVDVTGIEDQFSVVSYSVMQEIDTDPDAIIRPWTDFTKSNYQEKLETELKYLDADIFVLQSVAVEFLPTLVTFLKGLGYRSLQYRRRMGSNNYHEMIAFRNTRFFLESCRVTLLDGCILHQCNQIGQQYHLPLMSAIRSREVVILVTLRSRKSYKYFCVANTRCIPSFKERQDLQALQVCSIMKEISKEWPIILCGLMDFSPFDGAYQLLRDGQMTTETAQELGKIKALRLNENNSYPLSVIYKAGFKHPVPTMRSAYSDVMGFDPPNNWRQNDSEFVCSSYIFYDEAKIKVIGVLDMVDSSLVTDEGLPSLTLPSSSLSLKAVFKLI